MGLGWVGEGLPLNSLPSKGLARLLSQLTISFLQDEVPF